MHSRKGEDGAVTTPGSEKPDSGANEHQLRSMLLRLRSLGFHESADALERESGVLAVPAEVAAVRDLAVSGDFDAAERSARAIDGLDAARVARVCAVIAQQGLHEATAAGDLDTARRILQQSIAAAPADALGFATGDDEVEDPIAALGRLCSEVVTTEPGPAAVASATAARRAAAERVEQLLIPSDPASEAGDAGGAAPAEGGASSGFAPTRVIRCGACEVLAVAFSPCGRYLATSRSDRKLVVYSARGDHRRMAALCPSPSDAVHALRWHPQSDYILCYGAGCEVAVVRRSARGGEESFARCRRLGPHHDEVTASCWVDGGRRVATASADSRLALWSLQGSVATVLRSPSVVVDMAPRPEGRILALCADGILRTADPAQGGFTLCIARPIARPVTLSVDGAGAYCCITSLGAAPALCSVTHKHVIARLVEPVDHQFRRTAALSTHAVAVGGVDGVVRVWRVGDCEESTGAGQAVPSLEPWAELRGHASVVNCADWHVSRLATCSDDGTIRVWKLRAGGAE